MSPLQLHREPRLVQAREDGRPTDSALFLDRGRVGAASPQPAPSDAFPLDHPRPLLGSTAPFLPPHQHLRNDELGAPRPRSSLASRVTLAPQSTAPKRRHSGSSNGGGSPPGSVSSRAPAAKRFHSSSGTGEPAAGLSAHLQVIAGKMADMQIDLDPMGWLAEVGSQLGTGQGPETQEIRTYLERFADLYEKKLWYQLTVAIQEFIALPSSRPLQISLYQHFIRDFEGKIQPLKLVEIAITVSQRYEDISQARDFLSSLATALKPLPPSDDVDPSASTSKPSTSVRSSNKPAPNPEAYVLARISAAHFSLLLGQTDETKAAMAECEKILDGLDVVETMVRAGFYRVSGDLYKWEASYASYYKTSLLYLACLPSIRVLPSAERTQRAHDLCLAALLGDTIYNFGELLQHPILEVLGDDAEEEDGRRWRWLRDLVRCFSKGDLGGFESVIPRLSEEPILQSAQAFLQQKICLMALIDAVSRRNVTERTIPFAAVAFETKIAENEVEHLVMKALSLGLIKGSLDQVSRTVRITWVQPRVLDKQQIQALQRKLEAWTERVTRVGDYANRSGGAEVIAVAG